MKSFYAISGMPRAGSTLLCQILNSNPNFHVTPTSGTLDMLKAMRSNFSHCMNWKTQDRLKVYDNFRSGLKGFIEGFFKNENIVFDKNRNWPVNIKLVDEIFSDKNFKIIWLYRNPVEIVSSMEAQYQKTYLLENIDEGAAPGAFLTLDRRIGTYVNPEGIMTMPVEFLKDAVEMGYSDRILFVTYHELTHNTQSVLDNIHDFIGEEKYKYDLDNIKQTTVEYDGLYNYKFLHTIKEGKVNFKKGDFVLEPKFINAINQRFEPLNKLILEHNPKMLLGL